MDFQCGDDVLDVSSEFTSLRVDYMVTKNWARVAGDVGIGVGLSRFEGTRFGRLSERSLQDDQRLVGLDLQAGVSYAPIQRLPIRVRIGCGAGFWSNLSSEKCADCYVSGYDSVREATLMLGLVLGL